MKKDIPKIRKERFLPPRNSARQEGSTTKLKAKAERKPKSYDGEE